MKKNIVEDERMMLRVSDLYYNHNLNQQEIAHRLSISRPTVSKLLTAAREIGIVTITVSDLGGRKHFQMEQIIEEQYGLAEVFIIETMEDTTQTKDAMGKATAQFLSRIVKDNQVVGLSMGTSLSYIAHHIPESFYPNLSFIPLIGGIGTVSNELHSNSIVESLAKAYGGKYFPLHAPAMLSRKSTKTELMKETSIRRIFKRAEKMDIAIVGIGTPSLESTIIKTGYISPSMLDEINALNLVGDICMTFYDEEGRIDKYDLNERVMAIHLNLLRHTQYTVGVCCGTAKVKAVLGAIRGGFINVLITDYALAKALLTHGQSETD